MSLDDNKSDKKSVELGTCPSLTLNAIPFSSFPPSTYNEQDCDVDDFL
jgi:hypothetical protein